ncbi:MAG TPA: DUF2927 domain-containing protein [Alphaproteobacteria bacterium]|nr:DUF2927 domain-containing protein [Alphaproteobacteria bacterium]
MDRWRRQIGSLAIALAVMSASFSAFQAGAGEMSNAEILRNFDVIAFQNEVRHIPNPRVTKWVRPIRAYKQFDVTIAPEIEDFLDKHMERLAEVTGLDIEYVDDAQSANFLIIFTGRADYLSTALKHVKPGVRGVPRGIARRLRRTNCLGVFSVRPSNAELERAVVVIPVDHAQKHGLMTRCIVEETTQSLGLPNDSDDANPSVFNDRSRLKDLSTHDLLLLRLLYHPELEVGTPRRAALLTAARLLPQLRNE